MLRESGIWLCKWTRQNQEKYDNHQITELILHSLQHKFEVELKDGIKQTRTSTLVEYGSTEPNGYSAMAKLGKNDVPKNRFTLAN